MPITTLYGVTITVEAALSAATGTYGAWDDGVWDTATWGPDELWEDISDWVRSVSTTRRFGREVDTWQAGTATIVLRNQDGRFSPDNLSGPYVTAGVTGIRPWRPVRVTATYNGTTYPIYRGYALAWQETWTVAAAGEGQATVTVPCTDEFGRLAGWDGYATSDQGGGESTGLRVQRILDAAGHTGARDVDMGRMTLQPTDLSGNAVSQLNLVADSEGGAVYVGPDGELTFEAYTALVEAGRSTAVQATWGDQPSDLPYSDIETEYTGDRVINLAAYSRVGGAVQLVADNTSRALYGDRQHTRSDLIAETDVQVQALAALRVATSAAPERRITRIRVLPRADPVALWPVVLDARVRDLWRVQRTPPGGYTIDQYVYVAGITHAISAGNWECEFEFASATAYLDYVSSQFDSASWDSNVWFF